MDNLHFHLLQMSDMYKNLKGTDPATKCHICTNTLAPEDLAENLTSYVHRGKCKEKADAKDAAKKRVMETRIENKADKWCNTKLEIHKRVRRDAPPESAEMKAGHAAWLGKKVVEPTHLTSLDFPALSSGKNEEKNKTKNKEYGLGDLSRLLEQSIQHNAAVKGDASSSRAGSLEVTFPRSYRDALKKGGPSNSGPGMAWHRATAWSATNLADATIAEKAASDAAAAAEAAAVEAAAVEAAAVETAAVEAAASEAAAIEAAAAEVTAAKAAAAEVAAAEAAAAEVAAAEAAAAEVAAIAETAAAEAAAAEVTNVEAAAEGITAEPAVAESPATDAAFEDATETAAVDAAAAGTVSAAVLSLPPPLLHWVNGAWSANPPPLTRQYEFPIHLSQPNYYSVRELAVLERGGADELGIYGLFGYDVYISHLIFLDLLTGPMFRQEGLRVMREMTDWLWRMSQRAMCRADVLVVLSGIKARVKAFSTWALGTIKREFDFKRERGVIDTGNRGRSFWKGHQRLYRGMINDLDGYILDIEGSRIRINIECLVTCRILASKLMCLFRIL